VAVDGDINKSSCFSHHTCWHRLGKSTEILYHCWACTGCGSKLTWHGFLTYSKHYKVIDNFHMPVNVDLDELSCHYHHTCVEALNPHVMDIPEHPPSSQDVKVDP